MGQILRNWRIGAAVIFSVVSIVGAYMLARGVRTPQVAEASAESALLQAIATKDTDGDGLPDWEEALYGTDPRVTDTLKLGMQDGEAVARGLIVPKAIADIPLVTPSPVSLDSDGLPPPPAEGTLTAAFAKNFFTLFMAAKEANGGGDLSEAQMSEVANQALNSLASTVTVAPDYKSAKDINVSGSGADALTSFAVQAEAVLLKNTINATTSELNYLKSAVMNNDTTAIPHLASIAKGYRDSAVGLSMLAVPQELAADHLLLINAMMRVSEVTNDFARVTEDPLATMLALQLYPQAVSNLGTAFIHIGQIYKTAGITLPTGTPGASFVNLIENLVAKQAAKKQ
ncbi:hypothetical protein A3I46_01435 [Candidatus Kaiserbacteria bacterium RIFCSPLOWO2_02_FULL_54_13]|nr:MAG: hypothetical protein A3I46_01435 [Candidatus Kaiserbacteria bacterium RIFCSPLOWO2_02_FULL_54_13]